MLKKLNLRHKFIITMVLLSILPILIYGIVDYRRTREDIIDRVTEQNNQSTNNLAERVENFLDERVDNLKTLRNTTEIQSMDPEEHSRIFDEYLSAYPYFGRVYVTDTEGIMISLNQEHDAIGTSMADRPWFEPAIEGNINITNSFISDATNEPIVTISMPIKDDGEIIGVLGSSLELTTLQAFVEDLELGDSGYGFITDSDGIAIAHPDYEDVVLTQTSGAETEAVARALDGESGSVIYDNAFDEEMLGSYTQLDDSGFVITSQQPTEEAFSELNEQLIATLIMIIIIAIIATIVAIIMANRFSQPILEVVDKMKEFSNGDLKARLDFDREDELGTLANTFNQTVSSQKEILSNLLNVVEDLSAYSEELSASSEEGNASIASTKQLTENMSAGIEEISAASEEVASFSEEANQQVDNGNQNIKRTINNMEKINGAVSETVEAIGNLDSTSEEIEEIVELITNIAEQTNLLALNAAIEAARAGEHGQGFAVVADEIRELASETSQATDKIANLVNKTQEQSQTGIKKVKEAAKKAREGQEIVKDTGQAFNKIKSSVEETASQIEEIANGANKLARDSEEVSNANEDIKAMSDEITNSSQELAQMAQKLQNLIEEFNL